MQASIGRRCTTPTRDETASLQAAFRRYAVSNYVSDFDSYSGQSFQIAPNVRFIGSGEVVVQSHPVPKDGAPKGLSYVMKQTPDGWKAVDVLADGSISRVAVQCSDFRNLQRKVSDLSAGALAWSGHDVEPSGPAFGDA